MSQKTKPIILIANDDGIFAPGINALYNAIHKKFKTQYDIFVVAPDRDNSGTSHCITLTTPLRFGIVKPNFYAINGTPSDCITIALKKILPKEPVLILSGINAGANIGHDVFYSGTVAAACEGALKGIPSIAISELGGEKFYFEPAAAYAVKLVDKFFKGKLPPFKLISVNVPSIPASEIKGTRITQLGDRHYAEDLLERVDPKGARYFWMMGTPLELGGGPESDSLALKQKYISLTPLTLDMTDHTLMSDFTKISFK